MRKTAKETPNAVQVISHIIRKLQSAKSIVRKKKKWTDVQGDLCVNAENYLTDVRHCKLLVTLPEDQGWPPSPHVLGWYTNICPKSILIACKATKTEFLRDARNPQKRYGSSNSIGVERYWLIPQKMMDEISISDVKAPWGLLALRSLTEVVLLKKADAKIIPAFDEELKLLIERTMAERQIWKQSLCLALEAAAKLADQLADARGEPRV